MITYPEEIVELIGIIIKKYHIKLSIEESFTLSSYIKDENSYFFCNLIPDDVIRKDISKNIFIHGKHLKKLFALYVTFKGNEKTISIKFHKKNTKYYTDTYDIRVEINNTLQYVYTHKFWDDSIVKEMTYVAKDTYIVRTKEFSYYLVKGTKEGPYRKIGGSYKEIVGTYSNGYKEGTELHFTSGVLNIKIVYSQKEKIKKYIVYKNKQIAFSSYQNNIDKKKKIRVTSSFKENKLQIHYYINEELKATSVKEIMERGYI